MKWAEIYVNNGDDIFNSNEMNLAPEFQIKGNYQNPKSTLIFLHLM